MGLLGAVVGGAIGTMLCPPLGTVIGAILGYQIGGTGGRIPSGNGGVVRDRQTIFITSMFSCLAKMAKADGVVNRNEAEYIKAFINRQFAPEARETIRMIFNAARDNDVPYRYYIDQFAASAPDRWLLQQFLGILCELAVADGALDASEAEILHYAERRFGLHGYVNAFFGSGNHSTESDLRAFYEVLGCSESATDEEVKKAWRKKCAEFHPDKVQAKGLPAEFVELAKNEMQRVNRAYDEIKKSRGIK